MQYTSAVASMPTAVALCSALLLPPTPIRACTAPSASTEAAELTHARRYTEAAEAYGRAFEETGESVHLYSQAMSLRRAGSCREAVGVFETFIEQAPPEPDVEAARTQIAECEALLARSERAPQPQPQLEPPAPAIVEPPASSEGPQRRRSTRDPRGHDPWGGALVAMGGIVAVTGGGLLIASVSSSAPDGETERAHERRETSVRNTSIAGFALVGVGFAILIGGAVRYAIVARRGETRGLSWRF